MMSELLAARLVRDVPDFPKPGILFKDIVPVLRDPAAYQQVVERLAEWAAPRRVDLVAGIEARGFLFGAPLALELGAGFVPIRKLGKLPGGTVREEYALEYGTNTVEAQDDAIGAGRRVLIVDDVLATGGTAAATIRLVERLGGAVAGLAFLAELAFLSGRALLQGYEIEALITYP